MVLVAFVALDCSMALIPGYLAGGYVLAIALQLGLAPLLRSRGRWRRFWVGFEASGVIALAAFLVCRQVFSQAIARWPGFLYESYRAALAQLPGGVVDWLLTHVYVFDPRQSLSTLQVVVVLELTFGLPMLLLSAACGLLAVVVGPKVDRAGSPDGTPSPPEAAALSLPRMTTRRWMVAIAAMAALLGAAIEVPRLWIRRGEYLGLAEKYGYWETRLNGVAAIRQDLDYYSMSQPRGPEPSPERLVRMKELASYYASMRAKYEHAARFPWLPVAPDPARPGDAMDGPSDEVIR
jgi:hypothetical protein